MEWLRLNGREAATDKDALRRQLRQQFERSMEAAIAAVEKAPDGHWIAASEWQVREAFLGLMGDCYQRILQAKIDQTPAADTPPFSPSAAPAAPKAARAPRQGPPSRRRHHGRRRGDA